MRAAAFIALLAVASCAPPDDLPAQLQDAPDAGAAFPELEPLAPLLARAAEPGRVTARTGADLTAEAEALRTRSQAVPAATRAAPQLAARARDLQSRAAALRQTVVDGSAPDASDPAAGTPVKPGSGAGSDAPTGPATATQSTATPQNGTTSDIVFPADDGPDDGTGADAAPETPSDRRTTASPSTTPRP